MIISGIQRFTMLDFPDRTACIVFTPGCNIRCKFCHNPEFVLPELLRKIKDSFIKPEAIFHFLEKRKGLLDGVVISGGEPTMMPDLPDFVRQIKERGFAVKLDTNGTKPEIIQTMLEQKLLDYIAMDVKASTETYSQLVGPRVDTNAIKKSIALIKESGIRYEFRTTIIKEFHTPEILEGIAELVDGASQYYLQTFRPQHTLDPSFGAYHGFTPAETQTIADTHFRHRVAQVGVRSV